MNPTQELLAELGVMDDQARWQVMVNRDSRYDGAFVCAVRTTRIYCRPSCPAVRPKRQNVSFYLLSDAAEAEGYRPCKRCRPQLTAPIDPQVALVHEVCQFIQQQPTCPTLEELGVAMHVSSSHLQRVFSRVMGISPREYADARRVLALKHLLRDGKPVTEALYEAGYGSSSRLYAQADEQLGMTPSTYRKGGHGMTIGYSIQPCTLGLTLVAMTERGICAVYVSEDRQQLIDTLHEEFPQARISPAQDGSFGEWIVRAVAQVDGQVPGTDLPLDIRATAFQRRVWQALRAIPAGETRTYREIAVELGDPQATRAVASAIASNRIAILIPCHRVIRSDGGLGGYRWGIERKAALLARESETQEPQ